MIYPLAPEASAQLLAAMPMPAADVPAVAWWAVALAALWASGVLLMVLRTFGAAAGLRRPRCAPCAAAVDEHAGGLAAAGRAVPSGTAAAGRRQCPAGRCAGPGADPRTAASAAA
ncbi:hypothetical protein G6F62_015022 [Rhizopus arrhizus]|nr:hypothetical protein G6F62_015022 [Rhizopus arrhizus]